MLLELIITALFLIIVYMYFKKLTYKFQKEYDTIFCMELILIIIYFAKN